MGLDIMSMNSYGEEIKSEKFGSYGYLHILRTWIIRDLEKLTPENSDWHKIYEPEVLKLTKFPCIVDHSDCDGGYISWGRYGIEAGSWPDTHCLRNEIEALDKVVDQMPEEIKECFESFKSYCYDSEGDFAEIINFM